MSPSPAGPPQTLGLSAPARVSAEHDFSAFDCGIAALNDYARQAYKNTRKRNAVRYVTCHSGTMVVAGFYTLSNGCIWRNEAPKPLQRNSPDEIPVALLGRLAVTRAVQGRGVGLDLLQDALEKARHAAEIVGSRAVLVHALDARVADFYRRYAGFQPSPISPLTLFIAL